MLFIDPQTEYITVGKLRLFTRKALRELRHPIVINGTTRPTAIIMSYDQYLEFQENWIRAAQLAERMGEQFNRLMAVSNVG